MSTPETTFRREVGRRWFAAVATVNLECPPPMIGIPVSITRTGWSTISFEKALEKATALATKEAQSELQCQFVSTQCEVPNCGGITYPEICREATSSISQEDADQNARSLAHDAAVQHCFQ